VTNIISYFSECVNTEKIGKYHKCSREKYKRKKREK